MNKLYYGDNLEVLRDKIPDESVDLIYLDPPFQSGKNYNIIFAPQTNNVKGATAQIQAFEDTWQWGEEAEREYLGLIQGTITKERPNQKLIDLIKSMREYLGTLSMMAYLAMMAPRLLEMKRVLKDTGSIYLHCDPTASHYLKLLMDAVFGAKNFRNEIIWKRTSSLKTSQFKDRKFGMVTDSILFYTKSDDYFFDSENIKIPFSNKEIIEHYPYEDAKGRYTKSPLFRSMGMGERPNLCYEYKGVSAPSKAGWKISLEKLKEYDEIGDIDWSNPKTPYRKYRPEHTKGLLISNLWYDIEQTGGNERIGYPTQKPEALLGRIIKASSNEGDLVLDPFCGCGTAVAVAQRLNRKWIGIDITYLAIDIIKKRLEKSDLKEGKNFIIEGSPADEYGAIKLAESNPFQFQYWAISKINGGIPSERKTGDEGVDGIINFIDNTKKGNFGKAIISVKGTKTANPSMIRDLEGTLKSKGTDFGILITLVDPTPGMIKEAVTAGYYKLRNMEIPVIQIISVKDLFKDPLPLKLPITHIIPAYKSMKMIKPEATELEFKEEK